MSEKLPIRTTFECFNIPQRTIGIRRVPSRYADASYRWILYKLINNLLTGFFQTFALFVYLTSPCSVGNPSIGLNRFLFKTTAFVLMLSLCCYANLNNFIRKLIYSARTFRLSNITCTFEIYSKNALVIV